MRSGATADAAAARRCVATEVRRDRADNETMGALVRNRMGGDATTRRAVEIVALNQFGGFGAAWMAAAFGTPEELRRHAVAAGRAVGDDGVVDLVRVACDFGNLDALASLLDVDGFQHRHPLLRATDDDGMTPVHRAVICGDENCLRLLLRMYGREAVLRSTIEALHIVGFHTIDMLRAACSVVGIESITTGFEDGIPALSRAGQLAFPLLPTPDVAMECGTGIGLSCLLVNEMALLRASGVRELLKMGADPFFGDGTGAMSAIKFMQSHSTAPVIADAVLRSALERARAAPCSKRGSDMLMAACMTGQCLSMLQELPIDCFVCADDDGKNILWRMLTHPAALSKFGAHDGLRRAMTKILELVPTILRSTWRGENAISFMCANLRFFVPIPRAAMRAFESTHGSAADIAMRSCVAPRSFSSCAVSQMSRRDLYAEFIRDFTDGTSDEDVIWARQAARASSDVAVRAIDYVRVRDAPRLRELLSSHAIEELFPDALARCLFLYADRGRFVLQCVAPADRFETLASAICISPDCLYISPIMYAFLHASQEERLQIISETPCVDCEMHSTYGAHTMLTLSLSAGFDREVAELLMRGADPRKRPTSQRSPVSMMADVMFPVPIESALAFFRYVPMTEEIGPNIVATASLYGAEALGIIKSRVGRKRMIDMVVAPIYQSANTMWYLAHKSIFLSREACTGSFLFLMRLCPQLIHITDRIMGYSLLGVVENSVSFFFPCSPDAPDESEQHQQQQRAQSNPSKRQRIMLESSTDG